MTKKRINESPKENGSKYSKTDDLATFTPTFTLPRSPKDSTSRERDRSTSQRRAPTGSLQIPEWDSPSWLTTAIATWNDGMATNTGQLSRNTVKEIFENVLRKISDEVKKDKYEELKESLEKKFESLSQTLSERVKPLYSQMALTGKPVDNSSAKYQNHEITLMMSGAEITDKDLPELRKNIGKILLQERIRPDRYRKSRSGNIVVSFSSRATKEKAKIHLKENHFTTKDADDREVPIFVHGLHSETNKTQEMEEDLLASNEVLRSDDVKMIWIQRKQKGKETNVLKIVTNKEKAISLLKSGRLYSDSSFDCYRIALWKLSPLKCRKCLEFGHSTNKCTAKDQMCESCGNNGHAQIACDIETLACIPCRKAERLSDHRSTPKECPLWQERSNALNEELSSFINS